jgi:phosphoglucomutase
MSNVNMTIVLPRELKDKIRKLKNVNWSEVARKAFEEEIERIEKEQALEEIMRLREESKVEWEGAEVIRRWRNSH